MPIVLYGPVRVGGPEAPPLTGVAYDLRSAMRAAMRMADRHAEQPGVQRTV